VSREPKPVPTSLEGRFQRARDLRTYDAQLVGVLEPEQHLPGLLEHLGTARQVILDEAQRHWPSQSWESTRQGGPPEVGDLHLKVTSIIGVESLGETDVDEFVQLRIGLSEILDGTEADDHHRRIFGTEQTLIVPLRAAPALMRALTEQIAYWDEDPPSG
jgi:hypothetical protein